MLVQGWKFSILNITLQQMYHVTRVRASTEEPAIMNQEEATAACANGESLAKDVGKVREI